MEFLNFIHKIFLQAEVYINLIEDEDSLLQTEQSLNDTQKSFTSNIDFSDESSTVSTIQSRHSSFNKFDLSQPSRLGNMFEMSQLNAKNKFDLSELNHIDKEFDLSEMNCRDLSQLTSIDKKFDLSEKKCHENKYNLSQSNHQTNCDNNEVNMSQPNCHDSNLEISPLSKQNDSKFDLSQPNCHENQSDASTFSKQNDTKFDLSQPNHHEVSPFSKQNDTTFDLSQPNRLENVKSKSNSKVSKQWSFCSSLGDFKNMNIDQVLDPFEKLEKEFQVKKNKCIISYIKII